MRFEGSSVTSSLALAIAHIDANVARNLRPGSPSGSASVGIITGDKVAVLW